MEEKNYTVAKEELLFDIRLLADGIFDAEVSQENGALVFSFANGQKFLIEAKELISSASNIRQTKKDMV